MDELKRLALASERIDRRAGMVQSLRAELARKDAALAKIAAGNPASAGTWLTDIEMANIARAALEAK